MSIPENWSQTPINICKLHLTNKKQQKATNETIFNDFFKPFPWKKLFKSDKKRPDFSNC